MRRIDLHSEHLNHGKISDMRRFIQGQYFGPFTSDIGRHYTIIQHHVNLEAAMIKLTLSEPYWPFRPLLE